MVWHTTNHTDTVGLKHTIIHHRHHHVSCCVPHQVPPTLEVSGLSVDTALELLHTFPRALGKHPEMGHDMVRYLHTSSHATATTCTQRL